MINFFRRIRQRLITEGDLFKYLIYAIGEILLVVIGILFALQINNWNQTRSDIQSEKKVIKSILLNLEEDQANIDKSRNRYKLTRVYIKRFINGPTIPADSIGFVSTRIMGNAPFFHNQTAFDLATNSGELNLIRDKTLILKIQNFYSFDNNSPGTLVNTLGETQAKITDLSMEYECLKLEDINRGGFFNATYEMPFDIPKLKKRNADPRLNIYLRNNHFNMGILVDFYEGIKASNVELYQELSKYINSNF